MINEIVEKLLKTAIQNPDGFTVNIESWDFINFGFVASYKETQDSFERHQIENVVRHSLTHDKIVGGWLNSENKMYYFDSSKVFYSLDKAKEFAIENEQIAIFDLTNLKEIIIK